MTRRLNLYLVLWLGCCLGISAQMADYRYMRELKGISQQWHRIRITDDMFGKLAPGMHDIRIYGITDKKDTVEAPYLFRVASGKMTEVQRFCRILNVAAHEKGYYATLDLSEAAVINRIGLEFSTSNFDWTVQLEGSHDQKDWFTLLKDYRIMAIKNAITDFRFTELNFSAAGYRYFRIRINSKDNPGLLSARVAASDSVKGTEVAYTPARFSVHQNKGLKQTELSVHLTQPVPVSRIQLAVQDTIDFYRPVTIRYLSDSVKTEQGWRYQYETLATGILQSGREHTFSFPARVAQQLMVVVHNGDNAALNITSAAVTGYVHELIARFTEPAAYFLTYGNAAASRPDYDIERFASNIPADPGLLTTGPEQTIGKTQQPATGPLFGNSAWLWAVMILVMAVLGWFTFKMMRERQEG